MKHLLLSNHHGSILEKNPTPDGVNPAWKASGGRITAVMHVITANIAPLGRTAGGKLVR